MTLVLRHRAIRQGTRPASVPSVAEHAGVRPLCPRRPVLAEQQPATATGPAGIAAGTRSAIAAVADQLGVAAATTRTRAAGCAAAAESSVAEQQPTGSTAAPRAASANAAGSADASVTEQQRSI